MFSSIPKDWKRVPLSSVSERMKRRNSAGNTNVLTISAVHGLVNQKDFFNKIVASDNLSNYFHLKKGDFAYNKSYSHGYPVGVVRRLEMYDEGVLSPLYICFSMKGEGVDDKFAVYFFDSHWFVEEVNEIAKEGARNHGLLNVGVGDFFDLDFVLPPLPEQQKIAAILSSVDDVIEKTRAQIDKLKDLKTGMMQELLTKGIGHTAFKDSPVGRIPEGWDVLPLDSVVNRIIDCEHKTAPYVESSEYMVVRTSNVKNGQLVREDMRFTTEGGFNEWTRRAVPSVGDVLFTREAPAGESCMVPEGVKVCMGQRMVLLRPDSEKVYPSFFSLFLTSERAKLEIYELSIGTTVTRINIEDIRRILCIVPPLEEQKAIYSKIQSVQLLISAKEEQEKGQSSMKKALMQDLLTGKVRVNVDNKENAVA
ncbi:type I restriction enzyme S subunit [Alloalcanivorax xenomutans]|uniref:restriction endonuclease subunit S n=1 Tax=Alloalcanivorax xenomutans TaxID=1094342 RepID=UPI000BC5F3C1|nr:restriction endonuclease subunit S [Alloalcanivorax xenomutans]SOC01042.1 type I restriction enzyme S subunit [Alloalcanivorax xenomutans]